MKCRSKKTTTLFIQHELWLLHSPISHVPIKICRNGESIQKFTKKYVSKASSCVTISYPSFFFRVLMLVMRICFSRTVFIFPPRFSLHKKRHNNLCYYFAFNTELYSAMYTIFIIVPGLTLPYTKDVCLHQKSIIRSYTYYNTHREEFHITVASCNTWINNNSRKTHLLYKRGFSTGFV